MRFFILASIIAFVLEDHGTFQAGQRRPMPSAEEIALFKQDTIKLITAAARPLSINSTIMSQGCECIPRIGYEEELEPMSVVLATMSMANNYDHDLDVIQRESNVSPNQISNGMKETISRMMTILRYSRDDFELLSMDATLKHYLSYYPRRTGDGNDRNVRLGTKCYQVLIAMCYDKNRPFFKELLRGFEILRDIIQDESKKNTLMREFEVIVNKIYRYKLENPDPNFKNNDLKEVVKMLERNK